MCDAVDSDRCEAHRYLHRDAPAFSRGAVTVDMKGEGEGHEVAVVYRARLLGVHYDEAIDKLGASLHAP